MAKLHCSEDCQLHKPIFEQGKHRCPRLVETCGSLQRQNEWWRRALCCEHLHFRQGMPRTVLLHCIVLGWHRVMCWAGSGSPE